MEKSVSEWWPTALSWRREIPVNIEGERHMYDYGIKSIHDQKMRQFMIEAERARLIRQLRKNRPQRLGVMHRAMIWIREAMEAVPPTVRYSRLSA